MAKVPNFLDFIKIAKDDVDGKATQGSGDVPVAKEVNVPPAETKPEKGGEGA